mgnify:CR=1 FL=1
MKPEEIKLDCPKCGNGTIKIVCEWYSQPISYLTTRKCTNKKCDYHPLVYEFLGMVVDGWITKLKNYKLQP